jgi:DNA/RNA-binding domain of Phe-tRNA-synthetase-like protein
MLTVSQNWLHTYPDAHLGILAMQNVRNPQRHPELDARKRALENELRTRYGGATKADVAALPAMQPYVAYLKRFRKTYHVLLQLRSVALEGKPLPGVAALVEAMFMAELKNGLLTAAHDLAHVQPPVTADVAQGDEEYTLLNGSPQTLKPGDMMMTDAQGVICSVVYGSDRRTPVRSETRRVMFVVYAPEGVPAPAVRAHLEEIEANVLLVAPDAVTEHLHVYGPG